MNKAGTNFGMALFCLLNLAIPTIIGHPQSQSIAKGETATLNVFAIGQGVLSYQWFIGEKGDVSNPIQGANKSVYTTPALYATVRYWVRVCNADGCDDSDTAVITVVESKTVTLTAPNGGEYWVMGSTQAITWTTSGFSAQETKPSGARAVESIKIEYSIDGGTTYLEIIGSTENDGRHDWTVPNTRATRALVKVSSASDAGISDVSNAFFSLISATDKQIHLSRKRLFFGANAANAATKAQSVMITNPGEGVLGWTAAADYNWITVSPAAGGGNGVLQVGVNPAGLAEGSHAGTLTVSDPNAVNSPQTVTVTLIVLGTTSPPSGEFSTPVDGTIGITGAIPVTGWVVDDIEVAKVEILRDNVAGETPGQWIIGDAIFVEGARPDIEAAFPNYPLNYRAGWGYMMLTNMLPGQGNGTFTLYAYATDKEGNKVLLGTKTVSCDNAHATKPFGTIDTPSQGGEASGSDYRNFGWVLTPWPKTVAKDGSTIDVYVDSVKVGSLSTPPNVYDQYRVDVSSAFPGLKNTGAEGAGGPVGAYFLDTTKYANGVHAIAWVAFDDEGEGDGIGSRYFQIVNVAAASSDHLSHREPLGAAMRLEESSRALSWISSTPATVEDVLNLPVSFFPLSVLRGFDPKRPTEQVFPDLTGISRIELEEVELLELDLAAMDLGMRAGARNVRFRGYQIAGTEFRPLPIGSTLDSSTGLFAWLPGPGFLGKYRLLFIRDENGGRFVFRINVEIKPKKKF